MPKFRDIRTIRGDIGTVESEIRALLSLDHSVWIEVIFAGMLSASTVQSHLRELTDGTNVVIIRIKPMETENYVSTPGEEGESLEDLSKIDVFQRCLDARNIPTEDQPALVDAFSEILHGMNEEDTLAE